jgi:hypothetical protein
MVQLRPFFIAEVRCIRRSDRFGASTNTGGASGSVVGGGTVLQAGRSRV